MLSLPAPAEAQWFAGIYLGANHTHDADVTIDRPALGEAFRFSNVQFEGKPFQSPQYYGWRVGRMFGGRERFGIEFEFIHLKVIARTDRPYAAVGIAETAPGQPFAMSTVVQRYAMTHGLNFAVVNGVGRLPLGRRLAVIARAGVGPTIPHAETTIAGAAREQYEYGGLGAHFSAGAELRAWRFVSAAVDYKFTLARPMIDVVQGTGRTTTATHQVAFGLAFRRSR
jgi:hypothetical protein